MARLGRVVGTRFVLDVGPRVFRKLGPFETRDRHPKETIELRRAGTHCSHMVYVSPPCPFSTRTRLYAKTYGFNVATGGWE